MGQAARGVMYSMNHEQDPIDREDLIAAVKAGCDVIAPSWAIESFVAVNPFWNLRSLPFLSGVDHMGRCASTDLLPTREYFWGKLVNQQLQSSDFVTAAAIVARQRPELFLGSADAVGDEILRWLISEKADGVAQPGGCSILRSIDAEQRTHWDELVVNEIAKFAALYFDRGQATWRSPFREGGLYEEWLRFASVDLTIDITLGFPVRSRIDDLPRDYRELLQNFAEKFRLDRDEVSEVVRREILTIKGWASYVQHIAFQEAKAGKSVDILDQLVAIRVAYSMVLSSFRPNFDWRTRFFSSSTETAEPNRSRLLRYVCQVAIETRFADHCRSQFNTAANSSVVTGTKSRPRLQAIFCVDVRSEVFRRSLEGLSNQIETYGFAGFFGAAFAFTSCGSSRAEEQYPVLLNSQFCVREKPSSTGMSIRRFKSLCSSTLRSVRQSISGGFSFVESFGLIYAGKFVVDALGLRTLLLRGSASSQPIEISLDLARRVSLARGILKNTGLTRPYAPTVLLCGHKALTENNPYSAAFDCGACGGNGGEINARVAAQILNDAEVRAELHGTDFEIPDDTRFVGAVHVTTTDEVQIAFEEEFSESSWINEVLQQAGILARRERILRLSPPRRGDGAQWDQVLSKSRDWSEVRPEWGLARNAAFIAARRDRTREKNFAGRVFLHEYDASKDIDSSVLELIMTAPVIVASWINLQYFASSVAPSVFGAGDKVLHNVVGQLGVAIGNGGDLQIGLPIQSVHNGSTLEHEPLRLSVILEAPRESIDAIVAKHLLLQDLIFNDWITVYSIDDDAGLFRLIGSNSWVRIESDTTRGVM